MAIYSPTAGALPCPSCTAPVLTLSSQGGLPSLASFCGPAPDVLQQLHVSPALTTPKLDAVLLPAAISRQVEDLAAG